MKEQELNNRTGYKEQRNWYTITMMICTGFFLLMHLTFVGFTNDDVYFRDLAE